MIVADTSLLVAHLRGSRAATRFLKAQDAVVAPAVVAWELWKGATTAARERDVREALANCVVDPFSAAVAESAGALYREQERQGRRRSAFDLIIAAHAVHRGLPLATLGRDYDGIHGLKVVRVKD